MPQEKPLQYRMRHATPDALFQSSNKTEYGEFITKPRKHSRVVGTYARIIVNMDKRRLRYTATLPPM